MRTSSTYTRAPSAPDVLGGIASLSVGATDVVIVETELDSTGGTKKTLSIIPKAGGAGGVLATSQDSRAFLGVTLDGEYVYYSSNTSVLRAAERPPWACSSTRPCGAAMQREEREDALDPRGGEAPAAAPEQAR